MKLLTEGSWWLRSESNPKWNCKGYSSRVGGFVMPKECEERIKELEIILGEMPEDLEYGYNKY